MPGVRGAPPSSMPIDGSTPTTRAPSSAAIAAATPVPVPTSSTRAPAVTPASAARSRAGSAKRGACTRS